MAIKRAVLGALIAAVSLCAQQNVFHSSPKLSVSVGRGRVDAIAFSWDGKRLAAGASDGRILILNLESGADFRRVASTGSRVAGVAFTRDGALVVAAGENGKIEIAPVDGAASGGREIATNKKIRAIALSPQNDVLAVAASDNSAVLWSISTGKQLYSFSSDTKKPFRSLGFAKGGTSLVGVTETGQIWEWDVSTRTVLRRLQDEDKNVQAAAPGVTTSMLAISTQISGMNQSSIPNGGTGVGQGPSGGGISTGPGPSTPRFGIGGSGGADPRDLYRFNRIKIYDLADGRLGKPLDGFDGEMISLALSADNRFVAMVRQRIRDSFLDVIDGDTGVAALRAPFQGFGTAVAFSPDARWLASGSDRGDVAVYEVSGVQRSADPNVITGRGKLLTLTSRITEPLIGSAQPVRLAIMDFEASLADKDIGRSVADQIRNRIAGVRNIAVVERQQWERLIQEQNLQFSDRIDSDTAVSLGRGLGIQKMIFGRVSKLGTTYAIDVRMVDVETARDDGAREVVCQQCSDKDLLDAVALLRTALVKD